MLTLMLTLTLGKENIIFVFNFSTKEWKKENNDSQRHIKNN